MTQRSLPLAGSPLALLSRREALRVAGLAGLVLLLPRGVRAQTTTPACVLTPRQVEGPFYFDAALLRSDITEGRPGTPLRLVVTVADATTCAAIRTRGSTSGIPMPRACTRDTRPRAPLVQPSAAASR